LKLIVGDYKSVTAERLGINGEGIATINRMVVFIPNLLPGEEAKVEITRVERNYAEARVVKRDNASKDRVKPPCPIYDECGGCQIQKDETERRQIGHPPDKRDERSLVLPKQISVPAQCPSW